MAKKIKKNQKSNRKQNNNESNKIIKFQTMNHVNIGFLVFIVLFIYILVMIFTYASNRHITGYEVKKGSLAVDNTYRGVIMRTEQVINSDKSGYINYFARENEKSAAGSLIYTIDESGKLSDLLSEGFIAKSELTNEDLSELRTQILNYRNTYTDFDFSSVYDFKKDIANTANKLSNLNVRNSLSDIQDAGVMDMVGFGNAPTSGIVIYNTDGLENLTVSTINSSVFDEELHPKNQLANNSLVSIGDPAYKLITEEEWSIVIPIDEARYEELLEETYVKVRFLKADEISYGAVELFENEGLKYAKLTFTNSMIAFATDRYLDIELIINSIEGLKIPISAIIEKEFYLIPKEYITQGADSDKSGFLREAYLEDGTVTTEFIDAVIYRETDDYYYVDTSQFRLGDSIIHPNGGQKYSISKKDTLVGVYNMNKGYADFSQITILYQNREYAIVKSNTDYGLRVYDHIVLDGTSVTDDDFVFE